jgi:hypothetical protein
MKPHSYLHLGKRVLLAPLIHVGRSNKTLGRSSLLKDEAFANVVKL